MSNTDAVSRTTGSKIGALAGLVFALCFFIGVAILELPKSATDQELVAWWSDAGNQTAAIVSMYLFVLAGLSFLVFLVKLRSRLLAAEGGAGELTALVFAAGVVFVSMLFVAAAMRGVIGFALKSPVSEESLPGGDTLRFVPQIGYAVTGTGGLLAAALAMAGTSWLIVKTGVFGRWLAWLGTVAAAVVAVASAALSGVGAIPAVLVWALATSVALWRPRRMLRLGAISARGATTAVVLASVLGVAMLGVGCGGDEDETAATPTVETGSGAANAAADAVLEVEGGAEETMALADVQEAAMQLASPDWLTFLGGHLWVKQDDGMVVRIDSRTNRPNGKVRADTKSEQLCQGIGSGGGAVWSCSGSDIVRIDPKRLTVTDSIPVGKVFDQGKLVFVDGRIWVLTGEGDTLVGIDTATVSPGSPVKLPDVCGELGAGPDTIWALCPIAGKVLAVDPAGASVKAELEIESPSFAVATETDLWVGSAGDLVRVDVETLEPVARFLGLDPGPDGDVAVDGENVWVRTPAGFLHRIDATSNTVVEQVEPDEALSGGAVLFAAGSLWTSAFDNSLLLRLRPNA